MSYDVSIGSESFNYTYNVSKFFYDHIPCMDARGGLSELDGKTGKQAATIVSDAFDRITRTYLNDWENEVVGEPVFCARYDSKNGWGSTVGALIFLSSIMAACYQNPRSKVRVS
jgi:hypothetical protein